MNSLIGKFIVLTLGFSLSTIAIEATSDRVVMAQQLCQSYRVTRNDGLYVYINAGRQIITTLPYGQILIITGMSADGDWAKIEYLRMDEQIGEGWVSSDYLTCYQE
jgi:hypothetical protein